MTESEIQKQILKYLLNSPDICFCNINSTGLCKRKGFSFPIGKYWGKDKKTHNGLSDISGMTITGQYFAIEVKTTGKEPTQEQLDFINMINDNNGLAGYATSIKDAEVIIRGFAIKL